MFLSFLKVTQGSCGDMFFISQEFSDGIIIHDTFKYLRCRKWWGYCIFYFILLCFSFHFSSILVIGVFALYDMFQTCEQ